MAKSISSALAAHLASEVTTLATCWRVTRKDGRQFFFTDHDRDLAFDGNLYLASSGYSRSAIANDAGMAVDNLDVEGVLDHAQISEQGLARLIHDAGRAMGFRAELADGTSLGLRAFSRCRSTGFDVGLAVSGRGFGGAIAAPWLRVRPAR